MAPFNTKSFSQNFQIEIVGGERASSFAQLAGWLELGLLTWRSFFKKSWAAHGLHRWGSIKDHRGENYALVHEGHS